MPTPVEGPKEVRFRMLTLVLLWWALALGIGFSSNIISALATMFPIEVARGLMVGAVLAVGTVIIKKTVDSFRELFHAADREVATSIDGLSRGVSGLTEQQQVLGIDVSYLKQRSAEHSQMLCTLSGAVAAVDNKVEKVISYNDETKMRWQAFEDDWQLLRDDFDKLGSDSVTRAARILKDSVREFTMKACASTLTGACKDLERFLVEQFDGHLDEFRGRAEERLPQEFVVKYVTALSGARRFYITKLEAVCRGSSNGRRKKITDSAHVFVFDALELMISLWTEYNNGRQAHGSPVPATDNR